ncbi:hypothetical protein [Eubacterium limosum]|uniref:hypothetical protein n=1 Tax=Eubacterium limosum TaxID=1736 RepID=UPI001063A149|nr:hypothetical protein [Eubacterium limosum]
MDGQLNRVRNGELFFTNGDIPSGIMTIVGYIILALNLGIIARISYLAIQKMQGDDSGQITQQIFNCIKAIVIVNVTCTMPFVGTFLYYYLNYNW